MHAPRFRLVAVAALAAFAALPAPSALATGRKVTPGPTLVDARDFNVKNFLTRSILVDNKSRVEKLLDENRHIVEALRDALLDREELIAGEILDVIHAAEREACGQVLDLRR